MSALVNRMRLVHRSSCDTTACQHRTRCFSGCVASPARSQWLTAGVIKKQFADGVKEHQFIRADIHSTKDDADAFSLAKAKQIIDELGDKLFENG